VKKKGEHSMNALEQFEEKVLLDRSQKLLNKLSQLQKELEADHRWCMRIIAIDEILLMKFVLYMIFDEGIIVTFACLWVSYGFGYPLLSGITMLNWCAKLLLCTVAFFVCLSFFVRQSTVLETPNRWILTKIIKTDYALEQIGNAIDLLKNTTKNKQSLEPVLEEIKDGMLEMEEFRWKNK
jgi:hypothetical protein